MFDLRARSRSATLSTNVYEPDRAERLVHSVTPAYLCSDEPWVGTTYILISHETQDVGGLVSGDADLFR